MDCVITTQRNDIPLLKLLLTSLEYFYSNKNKIILFASKNDAEWIKPIEKKFALSIKWKEDILTAEQLKNGMLSQQYLKLISHQFVTTEYFMILDADFLFINKCSDNDLMEQNKPIWYFLPWDENSPTIIWKKHCEKFLKKPVPYLFMDTPQYVLSKEVASNFCKEYDLNTIFYLDQFSEFSSYGAYAYDSFPSKYVFKNTLTSQAKCAKVNQVPPTYCYLSPNVSFSDYENYLYVVFWSYWSLAQSKMFEFLKDSLLKNNMSIDPELNQKIYFPLKVINNQNIDPSSIKGIYTDGWVADNLYFNSANLDNILFNLTTPSDEANPNHKVIANVYINNNKTLSKVLLPGDNSLQIIILPPNANIDIFFEGGLQPKNSTDMRTLHARAIQITK